MIRSTVYAALHYQIGGYAVNGLTTGHTLYLFRDDDVIFYIGQSTNPLYRLQEHMGGFSHKIGASSIGILITANAPASYQWTYELWKPEECLPYVREYWQKEMPELCERLCASFVESLSIDEAEDALIAHFKPCLNMKGNLHATRLPERYRKIRT